MRIAFDNSYRSLPGAFYAPTDPTPTSAPALIRLNRSLAGELGIDVDWLESQEGLAVLSGNARAEGSDPLAMAYSGHQFGGFSPQLGDGRALLLGEVIGRAGVRYDIQLKGPGPTPFSRGGDGRSALGPVLREYIVSEAMAALGVPTTRALAAVASGDTVLREELEPGGILTRVARSHVRVGTFQWFAARDDQPNLRVLADYVIARLYPEATEHECCYRRLLELVIERQAELVAHWMQLGFIHGVMNTDNTNISGETLDYGPCAFLDNYDPKKKFSSIDHGGRYAFGNQESMAHWNLTRFAETLLPLLGVDRDQAVATAQAALDRFPDLFQGALRSRFCAKIGIADAGADDWGLVEGLLTVMSEGRADFTLVFRHLSAELEEGLQAAVEHLFPEVETIGAWLQKWRARLARTDRSRALELMRRSNPVFIARNHRIQEAIHAGNQGDFDAFHRLNEVLRHPFQAQPEFSDYENRPKPNEVVSATFCGT